jgi:aspartate 1-decarboxylase
MRRTLLKSKLHRATVTEANLHYVGSITIDRALMEAADIVEHEKVQVVDVDNGARLETYVIAGERSSGVLCLNGAAARLVHPGDTVIVISYAELDEVEVAGWEPTVVFLDDHNRVAGTGPEQHGAIAS